MRIVKSYIASLVAFLVVDLVWIIAYVIGYYEREVGALLREEPNMAAAVVFYLGYIAGVLALATLPALEARSPRVAVVRGAVLGAVAYGTYTVTNYAMIEGWTLGLVISDVIWGAFLTGLTAFVGYFFGRS
ncbi:MAG: DUF2177 family protein [Gammaproteobacteria bacterium]